MTTVFPTHSEKEKITKPCVGCGKETEICPMCSGSDPFVKEGQHGGFYVCQDKKCKEYQYCCGC